MLEVHRSNNPNQGHPQVRLAAPDQTKAQNLAIRAVQVGVGPNAVELSQIAAEFEAGKLKTVVSEVLPLSEIQQALKLSMAGHFRGKLALEVAE